MQEQSSFCVKSKDNTVDILAQSLCRNDFLRLHHYLGLHEPEPETEAKVALIARSCTRSADTPALPCCMYTASFFFHGHCWTLSPASPFFFLLLISIISLGVSVEEG
jgi:hypothetical protein